MLSAARTQTGTQTAAEATDARDTISAFDTSYIIAIHRRYAECSRTSILWLLFTMMFAASRYVPILKGQSSIINNQSILPYQMYITLEYHKETAV